MLINLLILFCVNCLTSCNRIELNDIEKWYSDYENLGSQDETSTDKFRLRINGTWNIKNALETAKKHVKKWLKDMSQKEYLQRQLLSNIHYVVLLIFSLIIVIWLLIFCHTGYGCWCCKSFSPCCAAVCDTDQTVENVKKDLLKLVPGGIYDDSGKVVAVYQPSEKEALLFNDAVAQIRRL